MSSQPTSKNKNDGLKLYNTYVTTALKCVPPGDKPTPFELKTCFKYFKEEVNLLKNIKVIVALGKIAFDACLTFYKNNNNFKNKEYISKDIFSDLKKGTYFYSGGWQIKGLYSMIIGFIFSAATIWNIELRFLQSFAWLIGAFVSYITYYLLASD